MKPNELIIPTHYYTNFRCINLNRNIFFLTMLRFVFLTVKHKRNEEQIHHDMQINAKMNTNHNLVFKYHDIILIRCILNGGHFNNITHTGFSNFNLTFKKWIEIIYKPNKCLNGICILSKYRIELITEV